MNFKTTIVLLVLALGVGAYFYFVERSAQTTRQREEIRARYREEGGLPVFDKQLAASTVTALVIERDGKRVRIERSDGGWAQTEPVRFPLERWSLDQLVESAAGLRYVERFAPGGERPTRDQAGLEPPRATLTLEREGEKKPIELRFGKRLSGRGYVARADESGRLYLVSDDLHAKVLEDKIRDWRKKSLDTPSPGQLAAVALERGGRTVEMLKADGQWAFAPPHSGRVSPDALRSLLDAAGGLSATRFVAEAPEDPSLYGLADPSLTLRWRRGGEGAAESAATQPATQPSGSWHELHVGGPVSLKEEKYFARWHRPGEAEGVVFAVEKADRKKLAKDLETLRDPRITPFAANDVTRLAIRRHGDVLAFRRKAGEWRFAGDDAPAFAAESSAVAGFVETLAETEAEGYRPDVNPDADPEAIVEITAVGRPQPDELRVYPSESPGRKLVVRNNETVGYLVPESKIEKLFRPALAWRSRTVAAWPARKLAGLTLERPDGVRYELAREKPASTQPAATRPSAWRLENHAGLERSALRDLLNALAPVKAAGWLDEPAEIGSPAYRLTARFPDGSTRTLRVAAESGKAVLEGEATPFKATDALREALRAELRERTVLDLATDRIERVALLPASGSAKDWLGRLAAEELGEARVVIERDDESRYVDAKTGEELDQSAAGSVLDVLGHLRAKRLVPSVAPDGWSAARRFGIAGADGNRAVLAVAAGEEDPPEARLTVQAEGEPRVRALVLSQADREKLLAKLGVSGAK